MPHSHCMRFIVPSSFVRGRAKNPWKTGTTSIKSRNIAPHHNTTFTTHHMLRVDTNGLSFLHAFLSSARRVRAIPDMLCALSFSFLFFRKVFLIVFKYFHFSLFHPKIVDSPSLFSKPQREFKFFHFFKLFPNGVG